MKAADLPRPWPLLAQHQDPASLEARVAFHLHRLKLVGRALHGAGYHKTDAADLAAGRVPLSSSDVVALADAVGTLPTELRRALTPFERREWAFYRASAIDPSHVWHAARQAWTGKGMSDRQAARIMHYPPNTIAQIKTKPFVLTFHAALRLTTALNLSTGPERFLPLPRRNTEQRSR